MSISHTLLFTRNFLFFMSSLCNTRTSFLSFTFLLAYLSSFAFIFYVSVAFQVRAYSHTSSESSHLCGQSSLWRHRLAYRHIFLRYTWSHCFVIKGEQLTDRVQHPSFIMVLCDPSLVRGFFASIQCLGGRYFIMVSGMHPLAWTLSSLADVPLMDIIMYSKCFTDLLVTVSAWDVRDAMCWYCVWHAVFIVCDHERWNHSSPAWFDHFWY